MDDYYSCTVVLTLLFTSVDHPSFHVPTVDVLLLLYPAVTAPAPSVCVHFRVLTGCLHSSAPTSLTSFLLAFPSTPSHTFYNLFAATEYAQREMEWGRPLACSVICMCVP